MKKTVLFAAMCAALLATVSCVKDDDLEMLKHPIHVRTEIDPQFGVPLASGQMNLNDVLSKMSTTFEGNIDDTADVITFVYEDSISGSSSATGSKKALRHRPARKDADVWLWKDTVISQTVPINFFSQLEMLDHIRIGHLWVDLSVGVKGTYQAGYTPTTNDDLKVAFKNAQVFYTDAGGTERPFFPPDRPIVDSIGFDDMTNWHMTQYDELDMASIINDKPQQVRVSFHLMLGIKASAIIGGSPSVNDSTIGQIIRNVQMMQLDYKAKIKVRMPFEVSITNMVYDYTLDIGEGLSSINLDSIISQISEESSVDVKNATFTLVSENGIPLELSLQARFLDANNNLLFKLFNGDTNIAPAPTRILEIDTIRNLDNSIRQIDTVYESSGFSPVKELTATLSQRKIEQLKETKGLKVSFRMNTSAGKIVAIKRSDMLKLRAYIKFHPKIVIDIPIVTEPLLK